MSSKEHGLRFLRAIYKKHKSYFDNNNLLIEDCVKFFVDDGISSVHVTNQNLPPEIQSDIKKMFWL